MPAIAIETEPLTTDAAADGYFQTEVGYQLPDGLSGQQLYNWFNEVQPVGSSFGQWVWCEDASAGQSDFFTHVWALPGTAEVLGFIIYNNPGSTTRFEIFKELSGPC